MHDQTKTRLIEENKKLQQLLADKAEQVVGLQKQLDRAMEVIGVCYLPDCRYEEYDEGRGCVPCRKKYIMEGG